MVFIYALLDPLDGRARYVGKADNAEERLKTHLKEARTSSGSHRLHWLRGLLAMGKVPTIQILEETTEEEWCECERFWIKTLRSLGFQLVNDTDGGEGGRMPDHVRLKMSEAAKRRHAEGRSSPCTYVGHRHSEEARAKMSAALRGKPSHRKGKTLPTSHREAISAANVRRMANQSERDKISAKLKGYVHTEETRAKMSARAYEQWHGGRLAWYKLVAKSATRKRA